MPRILVAAAWLCCALALHAGPARAGEPALWEVQGKHNSVYLFGSVHLLKPLYEQGVRVLCLHPLQTFTGEPNAGLLQDVPCAVTGNTNEASSGFPGFFPFTFRFVNRSKSGIVDEAGDEAPTTTNA